VSVKGLPIRRSELNAVTGALGCSGRDIARRLLDRGKRVLTLTAIPTALLVLALLLP